MCKQCKKCDPICKPHQQYTLEKCGICKKKQERKKERMIYLHLDSLIKNFSKFLWHGIQLVPFVNSD